MSDQTTTNPRWSDAAWWAGSPTGTPAKLYDRGMRTSRYLTLSDGCRLAADIHLPEGLDPGERIPTLVSFTPYLRGMDFRVPGADWLLAKAGRAEYDWGGELARYGYAFVHVEIRGAGASFGTKRSIFTDELACDGGEVLDWIVQQPWSNGRVGATGISALGLTSMMLATGKHPALKAIAPRFTVFDVFYGVHPGGLLENRFLNDIGKSLRAMDSNRLHDAADNPLLAALMRLLVKGVRGTDEDVDGLLLRAAVAEHAANEGFDRDIAAVRHRDERLPHAAVEATLETQSPFRLLDDIEASGVAVYAYAGWLDAAFQRELIHLYLNTSNPRNRLVIGPWAHGGRYYSSPLVADEKRPSEFPQAAELVRFFDAHLRDIDRQVPGEDAVQYFTMAEERWKSAPTWPPPGTTMRRLHLRRGNALAEDPDGEGSDRYVVDRAATTGPWSRYGKHLSGGSGPARYDDRAVADARLLCYTSEPLPSDTEVTGHPAAHLWLTCDREDAALFVYLEDVAPDGTVLPVTDGCLRLSMRKVSDDAPYRHLGVWRSGTTADVEPVGRGEVMAITLDLIPTSWLFRRGHRIRLAVAGADVDNFVPVPEGDPAPVFELHRGLDRPAGIDLPIMPRED